jgi:V8-like Glu-specific endopeptidase
VVIDKDSNSMLKERNQEK